MSKDAGATTISPARFGPRQPLLVEDVVRVAKMLHWADRERPLCHVSCPVGPAGWAGGSEVRTAGIYFRAEGTGYVTVLRFNVQILAEAGNITVGARCWFDTGGGGNVRFTIGATNTILAFTDADNGAEKTATLASTATGTGWLACTVELDLTAPLAGAGGVHYLRNVRVDEQEYAARSAPNE